jgi:hypothetical protein
MSNTRRAYGRGPSRLSGTKEVVTTPKRRPDEQAQVRHG